MFSVQLELLKLAAAKITITVHDHRDVHHLVDDLHQGYLNSLPFASSNLVAVANGDQITSPKADPVLVSHVPYDETRVLVLHCLILEIDDRDFHYFCTV